MRVAALLLAVVAITGAACGDGDDTSVEKTPGDGGGAEPTAGAPPARPDLDIVVYWLGQEFPGSGRLRALALREVVTAPVQRPASPSATVEYRLADEPRGDALVVLQEWERDEWEAYLDQSPGGNWWEDPCVKQSELEPEGSTVFAGYEAASGDTCPAELPDKYAAHVYIGDTIVVVTAPGLVMGYGFAPSLYNSVEGMEAVAAALEPWE